MGTANDLFSEAPAHDVTFRHAFLLAKYPVTQAQWSGVMNDNPSAFRHVPDLPVEGVNWDRASEFCRRVSIYTGRAVRLPSEAEWEYACRAGGGAEYFFCPTGPFLDDTEVSWPVREALCEYGWFDLNSDGRTQPVGRKRPNPFGLHDIVGNVWEWCADVWHGSYDGAPDDGGAWLDHAASQPRRSLRGGAWDMDAFRCRASYRSYEHREWATSRIGFRVAVDL